MNKYVRLAVSALLLGFIAWRTDWEQVGSAFARLRIELWLAAAALLVVTQFVSAMRWWILAGALGFDRPLKQITGICYIGMYFNLLLPTSVGGDVVRAWYLDGGSRRRLPAFVSVFLDRVSGLIVLVSMACVALLLSPDTLPVWVGWCVWGAAAGAAVGLLAAPLLAGYGRNGAARKQRVRAAIAVMRSPRVFACTTLLSLWVQAANVVLVWLVSEAVGAPVPFAYYWIVVPMVSLLTMLPVSVNGMGVREGGMALFLAPLGVGEGMALSVAFLWFSVYTAVSLGGGFVYLFGRFPRPVTPAEIHDDGRAEDGSVGGGADQGRAPEHRAAA